MNYEGESDYLILEVRNTKALRGWRMALTYFFRKLCIFMLNFTACYSWTSIVDGTERMIDSSLSHTHILFYTQDLFWLGTAPSSSLILE